MRAKRKKKHGLGRQIGVVVFAPNVNREAQLAEAAAPDRIVKIRGGYATIHQRTA